MAPTANENSGKALGFKATLGQSAEGELRIRDAEKVVGEAV
jgi:hypothetical protein